MKNLIPSGNKHVMLDADGTEYYKNARGAWAPGYYDGDKFIWASTRKYAARARTFKMADGTEKTVRLTKYTYKRKLRPAVAPVGRNGRQYKRAYLETFADLYWDGENLYRAANVAIAFDADGAPTKYINSLELFTDWNAIWDRYPEVTRDIVFDAPAA